MFRLGTDYGGWYIPKNIQLNNSSIIYSVGVGEDISFDIGLSNIFDPEIFLFDPTKRSKIHFNEIKEFSKTGIFKFSGDIQYDYKEKINCKFNINNIYYNDIGIWDKQDEIKFYRQNNKKYVSQSLINNMFGKEFDIVKVDTIKNIMIKNNHTKIDLLKLDIEGAEINVLNNMLDDKIYPTYILVEFDLYLKKKDSNNSTHKIINRLIENGYKILKNDNFNITFYYIK